MDKKSMIKITSREFQQRAGHYQAQALMEPVTVTNHGEDRVVVLSAVEYRRLKQMDRRALRPEDLTEAELRAIEKARVPEAFDYLDQEMEG